MEQMDFRQLREAMVKHQIAGRGVRDPGVLEAMRSVPRERFLPEPLHEFAYEDAALKIDEQHTLPQAHSVAVVAEALRLNKLESVLEIGTGTGYMTAVLSRLAGTVLTIESSGQVAAKAAAVLRDMRCTVVHVLHAEPIEGVPEHKRFDAIVVNTIGTKLPKGLRSHLEVGGRLVLSVGSDPSVRELVRVTRLSETEYTTEDIADIRVAPLDAETLRAPIPPVVRHAPLSQDAELSSLVAASCEAFTSVESADLGPLLDRIGDARIVLLGEATHGSSEFYRMRERISQELITRKHFDFIAIEGDWPDTARIDGYVRHSPHPPAQWAAFARFPVWMWRNEEMRGFVEWLRRHNEHLPGTDRVAFHGLDLYSLYNSIHAVVSYLDQIDPPTANIARRRYGCLTPWQSDPASYGQAALNESYRSCEPHVLAMLVDLLHSRGFYTEKDGERFLDAVQNARLVANAERYYRTMYYGSRASWNLRDSHMFETLENLLDHYGPASKAIVWAHNSHVGDARATEMSRRGEHNIGQLCRAKFGRDAYLVGFGTHWGTVAAASNWDEPMEVKVVRPSMAGSYERLCHESGIANFMLPLRDPASAALRDGLAPARLERAIGVIYRPETERQSHYFQAVLPSQFDEYIWFDQTHAVTPLPAHSVKGMPETYPFGV